MNNSTRKWIRGGVEILSHGIPAALISTFTVWLSDTGHWSLLDLKLWRLAGITFMGTGGLRFLQYWATHPLPDVDDTAPPIPGAEPPKLSLNPLEKVVSAPAPPPAP